MKNVAGTVDGQDIQGVWDGDDAVSVEPWEDTGTLLVGADGTSLFSQYAHDAARITIRLQHTSPTHRLLSQKLARQKTRGVRLTGFPLHLIDIDSNEGGSTSQAFIQGEPTDAKGKAATVREWTLVTGSWKREIPIRQ
jgi:hypothetical protein